MENKKNWFKDWKVILTVVVSLLIVLGIALGVTYAFTADSDNYVTRDSEFILEGEEIASEEYVIDYSNENETEGVWSLTGKASYSVTSNQNIESVAVDGVSSLTGDAWMKASISVSNLKYTSTVSTGSMKDLLIESYVVINSNGTNFGLLGKVLSIEDIYYETLSENPTTFNVDQYEYEKLIVNLEDEDDGSSNKITMSKKYINDLSIESELVNTTNKESLLITIDEPTFVGELHYIAMSFLLNEYNIIGSLPTPIEDGQYLWEWDSDRNYDYTFFIL